MPNANLDELNRRVGQVLDVNAAVGLLNWDQEVNMPPKAAGARGQQLATLSGIAHKLFTAPEIGELLKHLQDDGSLTDDERKLVEETAYDYGKATKLPEEFVEERAQAQSAAYEAWLKAKADADVAAFKPHLETVVDLCRREAEFLGYEDTPYNALLEKYERGMTVANLKPSFQMLADRQSALVKKVAAAPQLEGIDWIHKHYPADKQWDVSLRLLKDMGYDFDAGRQDTAEHPFTTEFDLYDVRVTTHMHEDNVLMGLMASVHEGGHAVYEQGFRDGDQRTVLAQAVSLGIHESQSHLWETYLGGSRAYWKHYGPILRETFPEQLAGVDDEALYRGVNRVEPGFIRIEADECTYNLHIVLRFELELALIEGDLAVADVPAAWNEKMKQYLGLDVPDDARGCLQDVHWSHALFGYFPTYTLGILYAAQLLEAMERDLPDLWTHVEQGNFCSTLGWLREHVHTVGRRKLPNEIIRDATGKEPSAEAFLTYLEKKYGELYGVQS